MIENLNFTSVSRFGSIIHEGFDHTCSLLNCSFISIRERDITSTGLQSLVYTDNSPVILDIAEGIAILYLLGQSAEENVKAFLLDKTVILNPGTHYGIASHYGRCTIKTAYRQGAEFHEFGLIERVTALSLYPRLEINKVHTLFYQEKEQGFIFKGEKHDFWELTYVDNGTLYSIVDGRGYKLCQGELIIYGINQHHIQWSDTKSSVCFVTVTFDMNFDSGPYLTDKSFFIDAELKDLLQKIIYEKEHNLDYSDDIIICCLKELIIKILRNKKLENTIQQQATLVKNKIENSIVVKSIEFIQKNIGSKIAISDIALSIPISQSYLSAIFKKHMSTTLIDYINNYRLEKSKDLIRSSELNFTQIAEMLGYASVHYFSTQFKQKFGTSPTGYSKSIRAD